MERPSVGVKGLRNLATGSKRGSKGRSFGPATGHLQLAKSDFNPREAGLTEDTPDGAGDGHRIAEEEGVGLYTDPNKERAKWLLLPNVGEGDRVDGRPHHAVRVEELVDIRPNIVPGVCNGVAIDRPQLADDALGFRTLSFRPGRTRLIDAGSTAGNTEEVCKHGWVVVGEMRRV